MTPSKKTLPERFEEVIKFIETTIELSVADRKEKRATCKEVMVELSKLPSIKNKLHHTVRDGRAFLDLLEQMYPKEKDKE